MVQILHLMSIEANLQTERTSSLIRQLASGSVSIATRSIGRGGNYRNIAHAALSLRFGRGTPFDVIHAFDTPSLLAACAAPSPLVFSPADDSAAGLWWRGAMVYRKGTVIATTESQRRRLISQGIPPPRCDVIPPPLEPAAPADGPDPALRDSLNLSPDDRVILAPSESTRSSGHLLALHAVSILHVLDSRCRLLIWGRGESVGRLRRLARSLRQPRLLVMAEPALGRRVEFERLVRLADLALIGSSELPVMATAICMAAGVPIVSGVSPSSAELLQDHLTASLAPKLAPRLLAQRLLQAIENRTEAMRWGKNAQLVAAGRFDGAQAVRQFIHLYQHAAGISPKRSADVEQIESVLSK